MLESMDVRGVNGQKRDEIMALYLIVIHTLRTEFVACEDLISRGEALWTKRTSNAA